MEQIIPVLGLFVVGTAAVVVLFWACREEQVAWLDQEKYLDTHPPINDDEFLRRCSPGVTPEVALKVRQIMSEISGVAYEQIYPDAELVRDLGLD